MPVLFYRGGTSGANDIFGSPNFLSLHGKSKTSWTFITSIILIFIIIILLSSPNSVQPRASYIAFALTLLLFWFILKVLFCYLFKKYHIFESLTETDEQTLNPMNNIYSIDETFDRQTTNGSQVSLNLSEYSMPPKYEMPPSYSQAVSTLTINY